MSTQHTEGEDIQRLSDIFSDMDAVVSEIGTELDKLRNGGTDTTALDNLVSRAQSVLGNMSALVPGDPAGGGTPPSGGNPTSPSVNPTDSTP